MAELLRPVQEGLVDDYAKGLSITPPSIISYLQITIIRRILCDLLLRSLLVLGLVLTLRLSFGRPSRCQRREQRSPPLRKSDDLLSPRCIAASSPFCFLPLIHQLLVISFTRCSAALP